ncbi:MAG: hypothetical protein GY856_22480 [bacterium]|nr:hypothetical protein [bacterium]
MRQSCREFELISGGATERPRGALRDPGNRLYVAAGDGLYVANRNAAMISVADEACYEMRTELTHQGQLG